MKMAANEYYHLIKKVVHIDVEGNDLSESIETFIMSHQDS